MDNNTPIYRIVADSAADLLTLESVSFGVAPLKIITSEKEYTDTENLDVADMVNSLKRYNGRSTSSCPNPEEWLKAFGEAKYIFVVTISGGISGSCASAQVAKEIYETEHPDRHVFLIDSLSAGPEETLLVEKLEELITANRTYEEICEQITAYQKKTGLYFMLESLNNFANNGRVNPAIAKIAGVLGICIVGRASDKGTLEPTDKCRGIKKSVDAVIGHLKNHNFTTGKIRIAHCFNEKGAIEFKNKLKEVFKNADIKIHSTRGLCSFYAEKGGILVGYETV